MDNTELINNDELVGKDQISTKSKIEYLSPTRVKMFYSDKKTYYLTYLTRHLGMGGRIDFPQSLPMAVGSAFDAFVKSYLHEKLFGGNDPRFKLSSLFESQVQENHRDYAWIAGKYLLSCYLKSGALTDLMLELESSIGTPRFEFEVRGVVNGEREGVTKSVNGIMLLGKPDVYYINKHGMHVVLDFKVNGYCSKWSVSPSPGYIRLRNPYSRASEKSHRDCVPMLHKGTMINIASNLENVNEDWAIQLTMYAWLLGCAVGSEFVVAIDQICCNNTKQLKLEDSVYDRPPNCNHPQLYPEVKIAEHRLRVGIDYQYKLFEKVVECWEVSNSDHFFREVSLEESQNQCKLLDEVALTMNNPQNENDDWLLKISHS